MEPSALEDADGNDTVEFVDPPPEAEVGERILPETFEGGSAPLGANQVKKKKVWEEVAPVLATDGDRVATFGGVALVGERCGKACRAPSLPNAPIS